MNGKGLWAAGILAVWAGFAVSAAEVELVSRTFATPAGNVSAGGHSLGGSYSPDGSFLLFSSDANDLVEGPANFFFNVFALSRATGNVQEISVGVNGSAPNNDSEPGNFSRDNRFVVFQSNASNLVANDGNGFTDIFLRDLTEGTTTLVSHLPAQVGSSITPNERSEFPQISEDGSWVVFESLASNMVSGGADANGLRDIYAWNRADGKIHLVSAGPRTNALATESSNFTITADSRFVLFEASGVNLVQTNRTNSEIYLRDLQTETTRWVSWPATNLPNMSAAAFSTPAISRDGRYVAFVGTPPSTTSFKPALVRVDLNDNSAVIVTNVFPSVAPYLAALYGPSISDNGQFIAWANGTNVFRWNAVTGLNDRVDAGGDAGARLSDSPEISGDGRFVLFLSDAANLVTGVSGAGSQLYVRDMELGVTRLVSQAAGGGPAADLEGSYASFSPDGSKILLETQSSSIVAGDGNDAYDLFEWDSATGNLSLLTTKKIGVTSLTGSGSSSATANSVSAGGRLVVFTSLAQISPNDTNLNNDVYLYDRARHTNILISVMPDGFAANSGSGPAMVTPDGKWVVFESFAKGLAGVGDARTAKSLYARNVETGAILNISGPKTGAAVLLGVTGNSRYVYFNNGAELHLHDLIDHTDTLLSTTGSSASFNAAGTRVAFVQSGGAYLRELPDGVAKSIGTVSPVLSANGAFVAYRTTTSIIVTNWNAGTSQTFAVPQVSRVAIDGQGRIIAYTTSASTATGPGVVGFIDRLTGQNVLVSRAVGKTTAGNDTSGAVVVSPDGRFIAFESWASDLVEGDANALKDVFLYDRFLDRLTLVSHKSNSNASGNSISVNPYFSADGSFVLFSSLASDLVSADLNEAPDIYLSAVEATDSTIDSDGDGLPDSWERAQFSTLQFGATDDFDNDGFSNGAEFRAGTNPLDAQSSLSLRRIEMQADGSRVVVWNAVSGRHYLLEFKASIDSGAWTSVGSEVVAAGSEASVVDAAAGAQGYYRIRLVE